MIAHCIYDKGWLKYTTNLGIATLTTVLLRITIIVPAITASNGNISGIGCVEFGEAVLLFIVIFFTNYSLDFIISHTNRITPILNSITRFETILSKSYATAVIYRYDATGAYRRLCDTRIKYHDNVPAVCYTFGGEVFQMKQRYVPLGKRSKREQRAYYTTRRGSWGALNPVTRKPPNPKAYNRKKSGQRYDNEPLPGFLFYMVTDTQEVG